EALYTPRASGLPGAAPTGRCRARGSQCLLPLQIGGVAAATPRFPIPQPPVRPAHAGVGGALRGEPGPATASHGGPHAAGSAAGVGGASRDRRPGGTIRLAETGLPDRRARDRPGAVERYRGPTPRRPPRLSGPRAVRTPPASVPIAALHPERHQGVH